MSQHDSKKTALNNYNCIWREPCLCKPRIRKIMFLIKICEKGKMLEVTLDRKTDILSNAGIIFHKVMKF